ncbi:MAG: DoxX family protein [Sphingobacteriales bacterium]|nr:MAG: DoxX family protein [Sphingobacteriales bacterium]
MKKTKITYWILTGLLAVLMTFSSIPDIVPTKEAVDFVTGHLGYPEYFLRFIGIAKMLGVIAIIVPGFPRLKEWAYAGLVFDLIGAMYSMAAVGDPVSQWFPLIIGLGLIVASYIFYHKLQKQRPLHPAMA